jgi:Phosphodiester glycosidase
MTYLRFYLAIITVIATNVWPLICLGGIAQANPQLNPPNQSIPLNVNQPAVQKQKLPKQKERRIQTVSQQPTTKIPPHQFVSRGTEIFLNGKTLAIPWGQWQVGNSLRLGISDTALTQQLGVELFNNSNYTNQPIDWYATQPGKKINLVAKLSQQYRYLDITDLAQGSNWQWQVVGGKLQLNTPATTVVNVQRQNAPKNGKINITLDRYTPWKLSQTPTEGYLTIEANADPALLAQFNAPQPIADPNLDPNLDPNDDPTAQKLEYKVTTNNNQTIVQFPIVKGQRARAKLLSPTNIEVNIDASLANIPEREIKWARGMEWRQKWMKLGADRFPVTYLEIDPRQQGIKISPMLAEEPNLTGTNHLIKSVPPTQFAAAINGGYFNRKNRMPLGALKRDGKWLSSPILNRGAIGWNDRGQIRIARLQMNETLTNSKGEQIPILTLNSGYVQPGIGRYNTGWGKTYSPMQSDELIVTVQQDKVTQIVPGNAPGSINVSIPTDGYLLALRGQPELSGSMPIGMNLTLERQTNPPDFDTYSQVVAAGPWLVQSGKVVLDAKSENFSAKFSKETAVRSAIANTTTGKIIFVAVHDRAGGKGPTLSEMAQILQQMGTVEALNLDGGSSTSLYLGGQLINRASATAARVHNAIGISLAEPLP